MYQLQFCYHLNLGIDPLYLLCLDVYLVNTYWVHSMYHIDSVLYPSVLLLYHIHSQCVCVCVFIPQFHRRITVYGAEERSCTEDGRSHGIPTRMDMECVWIGITWPSDRGMGKERISWSEHRITVKGLNEMDKRIRKLDRSAVHFRTHHHEEKEQREILYRSDSNKEGMINTLSSCEVSMCSLIPWP